MIIHKIQNQHKYNKEQRSTFIDCNDCGMIHAPNNWKHKRRFLEKYELIFVSEGILFLQVDGSPITLNVNDLIIIPPYKTISGTQESKMHTSFYWVDFLTDDSEHFGIVTNQIRINHPDRLTSLLDKLAALTKQKNSDNDFTKDSLLLLILHLINENTSQNSPQHMIINKISSYIETNISKPLTVEMVADALKYNKDYISRLIKSHYGISLKDYISKQKLNLAKKLLTTSNYSIRDISDLLGYDDSNLFTKFFKYHENMSPNHYRMTHGGGLAVE
jgi:YesN/AraC family two-component response regulator